MGHKFSAGVRKVHSPSSLKGYYDKFQPARLGQSPSHSLRKKDLVVGVNFSPNQFSGTLDNLVIPSMLNLWSAKSSYQNLASKCYSSSSGLHEPSGGTRSLVAQREINLILAWAESHIPALTTVYIPDIGKQAGVFWRMVS